MHRNRSVNVHQFSMVPRTDIPRSSFRMQKAYKTTFDAGYLVPIYCEEVLPGDTFNLRATMFARLATPLFPIMDNMYLESFFFFVPNRLVWDNWVKFMGEQTNPGDSISYNVPYIQSYAGGYAINTVFDYFGLPTVGQVSASDWIRHSALPLRAYNLIYNQWFRDENLQSSLTVPTTDGPDNPNLYSLVRRGKRHDYFTSALPWTQKGASVPLPLGSQAPVKGIGTLAAGMAWGPVAAQTVNESGTGSASVSYGANANAALATNTGVFLRKNATEDRPDIYADLSQATAATINQIRQAFQIQRLLERDARGGTRYTELVRSHFGVLSPDARLQRPEYLGGGSTPINVNPIAQTSATGLTGATTPLANLSAIGTALAHGHGFTQSFVEHGYVIGLVNVRADLTYQQGLRRHWSRSTRYDFYFPVFAHLGEQAILNKEIYCTGLTSDDNVFGYQERWGEYRYTPSEITGLFRSTAAGTVDPWHLAQRFSSLPTLNATFISDTPPVDRIVAVGAAANGKQFLLDVFFDNKAARPLPLYGVPGLVDHF